MKLNKYDEKKSSGRAICGRRYYEVRVRLLVMLNLPKTGIIFGAF